MKIGIQDCKDKRWKALQAKIFERDCWCCVSCGDAQSKLFVHLKTFYPGKKPWEYPENELVSLCEDCLAEERQLLGTALKCLTEAARKQFLSSQIHNIACSLLAMKKPTDSETVAEAISLWLRMPRLVEFMVETYHRKLESDERKRADAEKTG